MIGTKKASLVTAGFVMLASVVSGATAATTTAGKCSSAYLKFFSCVTEYAAFSSKIAQKFCKKGGSDASQFGEKLAKSVNKCAEKFNDAMAKDDCINDGDPNAIAGGQYAPQPEPLVSSQQITDLLTGEVTPLCNGVNDM